MSTTPAHPNAPDRGTPPAPGDQSAQLKAYSVGGSVSRNVRRLHLNEFRYGHHPDVVAALRHACSADAPADLLTNYQPGPDPALADDVARYVGAPSRSNVLLTPGSDDALRAVIDTSALRGHRRVLMGVPGYTHFEHFARLKGLELVTYAIGLATPAADHEAALRYHAPILAEGCLVYLCSPNNPTGDLWGKETVATLAAQYPRSLFLLDEAYVEFASCADGFGGSPGDPPEAHAAALNAGSLVPVALERANVIVTRTFSKAFGLAALRVGYAVGHEATLETIRVAVSPKAFNPLAASVARAALQRLGHYRHAAASARREAKAVVAGLRAAGWWALDTPGNFYLVYAGDAPGTTARLAALGVQVRDRGDLPGLAGFVRLTAGTSEDSVAVSAAFSQLTPPAERPPQTLYTPKGVVAAIKTLLRDTLGVLAVAGIPVWAQGGTMLGICRHQNAPRRGGMIPTDDDADLAYLIDGDVDPVAGTVSVFRAAGLTLQRNRTNAYWQVGTNIPDTTISPIHIDVFSYSLQGGKYVLGDERFREEEPGSAQAHCNTKYAPDELFPLDTSHTFYDLRIPIPARSEEVLRRALGADYMQVMRIRTQSGLVEVFLKDYSPA